MADGSTRPFLFWWHRLAGQSQIPSSMSLDKTAAILVVGAGTWGSSTALHLARRGYSNVTVLDAYPVPSAISAGNDIYHLGGTVHDRPR